MKLKKELFYEPYIYLLLASIISSLVLICFNTTVFNLSSLERMSEDPYISVSCLSGSIAFLCLLPCDKRRRAILFSACLLAEICYIWYRLKVYTLLGHLIYIGPPSFLVCILFSFYCLRAADSKQTTLILNIFGLSLVMPFFSMLSNQYLNGQFNNDPYVYDWMLMKAEILTYIKPCFFITYYLRSNYLLQVFMYLIYSYLPLWMMIAQIIAFKRDHALDREQPKQTIIAPGIPALSYIAVIIFGTLCYRYFPAVGPQNFLGSDLFPYGTLPYITHEDVRIISVPLEHSRNCMPSLHLTWILCAYFSIYNLLRAPLQFIWLLLSFLTLGSAYSVGCHWTADFFVALPFTAFCLGLTWYRLPNWWRVPTIIFGGLAAFGMMFILKHHIVWCTNNIFMYWSIILLTDILAVASIIYALSYMRRHFS